MPRRAVVGGHTGCGRAYVRGDSGSAARTSGNAVNGGAYGRDGLTHSARRDLRPFPEGGAQWSRLREGILAVVSTASHSLSTGLAHPKAPPLHRARLDFQPLRLSAIAAPTRGGRHHSRATMAFSSARRLERAMLRARLRVTESNASRAAIFRKDFSAITATEGRWPMCLSVR